MDNYKSIRDNLVLTHHSKENLYGLREDCDRTDISVHQIAQTIQKGIVGFSGHRRMKKTYNGIEVIYKRDRRTGQYIIITYYRTRKSNRKDFRKVLDF